MGNAVMGGIRLNDKRALILIGEGKIRKEIRDAFKETFECTFVDSAVQVLPEISENLHKIFIQDWQFLDSTQSRQLHSSLARLEELRGLMRVLIVDNITAEISATASDLQIDKVLIRGSSVLQWPSLLKSALLNKKYTAPAVEAPTEIRKKLRSNYTQGEVDNLIRETYRRFLHHTDVRLEYGHLCVREAKLSQAQAIAQEILDKSPENVRAVNLKSRVLLKQHKYDRALKALSEADRLSPENPQRLVLLGEAFFGKRDLPNARSSYLRAFTLDPSNKDAARGIGTVSVAQGDYEAARSLLADALSEDEAASFFNSSAISCAKDGRYSDAIDLYLSALNALRTPDLKHFILYNAAISFCHLKKRDQAVSVLQEAQRLCPKYEKAARFLSLLEKPADVKSVLGKKPEEFCDIRSQPAKPCPQTDKCFAPSRGQAILAPSPQAVARVLTSPARFLVLKKPHLSLARKRSSMTPSSFSTAPFASEIPFALSPDTGTSSSGQPGTPRKVLLCLYNMGGPASLDDVGPFLLNLFSDNDLIDIPFPSLLQDFVARKITEKRTPGIQSKYAEIGGGSPQLAITQKLCLRLEAELKGTLPAAFQLAGIVPLMRYTAPRAAEALARARQEGVDEIWLLTQYPHCARATTGTSLREIALLLGKEQTSAAPVLRSFARYGDDPAFHKIWASRLTSLWQSLSAGKRHLIVSAHNLPVSYIAEGDPYRAQIYETARQTLRQLNLSEGLDWTLAWQSAVGPVRWMKPDTRDVIRDCARQGLSEILIWPIAFVSDHIETQHEIDIEFADIARGEGISVFKRVENLNDGDEFVSYLRNMVTTAATELAEKGQTLRLRELSQHPSGEGCHWQAGGCLCGRYFKSGEAGLQRGKLPRKLPGTVLKPA